MRRFIFTFQGPKHPGVCVVHDRSEESARKLVVERVGQEEAAVEEVDMKAIMLLDVEPAKNGVVFYWNGGR